MIKLEWNALRIGDEVLVHDPDESDLRLLPGDVAMVQTKLGSNDIGIRVSRKGEPLRVLRPARLTVHLDPRDPSEPCWRCDALAAQARRVHAPTARSAP